MRGWWVSEIGELGMMGRLHACICYVGAAWVTHMRLLIK